MWFPPSDRPPLADSRLAAIRGASVIATDSFLSKQFSRCPGPTDVRRVNDASEPGPRHRPWRLAAVSGRLMRWIQSENDPEARSVGAWRAAHIKLGDRLPAESESGAPGSTILAVAGRALHKGTSSPSESTRQWPCIVLRRPQEFAKIHYGLAQRSSSRGRRKVGGISPTRVACMMAARIETIQAFIHPRAGAL